MEDLNNNLNVYDDDNDGDGMPNFLDSNDDNDTLLNKYELSYNTYMVDTNQNEQEPTCADNEYELSRSEEGGLITIVAGVLVDSNNDGILDYLDKDVVIDHSNE
jgi:hypothetical protein